jgi:hypothetical protein
MRKEPTTAKAPAPSGRRSAQPVDQARAHARQRGGRLISRSVANVQTMLLWECAEGHRWRARLSKIKRGMWCPLCGGTRKLTLELLREEASRRGGKLLSDRYSDAKSLLLWECAEEHRWKAPASRIRSGAWCPRCAGETRLTIEEMCDLARANGGQCLSKRYVNNRTPLKWQCANGHIWRAMPVTVKPAGYRERGTWCPECARAPLYTLDDMRELAARRGGQCLSKTYVNYKAPLNWLCAEGHIWKASANSIRPYTRKTPGSWCPVCAIEKAKLTIADMRAAAAARGGECLSAIYVNIRTPLRWRCAEGHEWEARPGHVRPSGPRQRSSWCPVCSGVSSRIPHWT